MENAAKALLIAAGVLIGLILVSLITFGYNEISNYYTIKEQTTKGEQLADFNEEYIPYNRDDVRGTDLISLVNRAVNFNTLNDEEEITISIDIKDATNIYYGGSKPSDNRKILINIDQSYDEGNIGAIVEEAMKIERTYPQGKAKKLAENLFTLMKEDTEGTNTNRETAEEAREKLFKQLKIDYNINQLITYQTDILKYYQYIQFKRAHFDCTQLTYTSDGRVKSFSFRFTGKFE